MRNDMKVYRIHKTEVVHSWIDVKARSKVSARAQAIQVDRSDWWMGYKVVEKRFDVEKLMG